MGVTRPCRVEADIVDLEIDGEIPAELNGTLYRAGPDNRFAPMLGDDQVVHGDGMITMLRIRNGKADFKSRYVRTDRFLAEEKAGRSLFGAYRNPYTDDPGVGGVDRGTANTNVVFHAGRLLALKEDSLPVEIDRDTLETIGKWTAEGTITSSVVTAHPHPDAATGELLMFGFQAKGIGSTDIVFLPVGADGKVAEEIWFQAPYACLMHDYVCTENYALFQLAPAVTFHDRVKQGAPYYLWDATKKSYIGALPRNGTASDIRWFEGPPRVSMHYVNAFEEDGKIVIHANISNPNDPPFFPPADVDQPPPDWRAGTNMIAAWTLDPADESATIHEDIILDTGCFTEMPRVDERMETRKHRYAWWMRKDQSHPCIEHPWPIASCNVIERFDFVTHELDSYRTDDNWAPGEPLFIPRHRDADEGDGFVIVPAFKLEGQGSDFHVFEALNMAGGPIATIHVPYHFRPGFHGNWIAD